MIWPFLMITAGAGFIIARGTSLLAKRGGLVPRSVVKPLIGSTRKFPLKLKGFENPMSIREAYKILNVPPIASKARVREAHRQLMLRNHPDNGGSNYVASKVNEAKELICGDKNQ
ncbi:DnaJ domain-containing protein [Cryptosporidium ubiquitum]|uniref:DnaJ domain-containing protein n=1 Tax=Cryptosporidium ubiquitum TaxID=857276 RepID=A0A1J4MRT7_9CRYT|nr:DnaJ domain-containing protein [Cryptosporidium ubiquitum]OII75597.1 DnaJ domain-containing protein [Cryptosporidium ubiquitum]